MVLTGGSAYGLAAADGVVKWLAQKGLGFPLEGEQVAPIVPAAALFDLGHGADFFPPIGPEWGRAACKAAADCPVAVGSVGAGTGALAGGIKGGLGTASERLGNGLMMAAIVAVNSLGTVIDPRTGRPWEIALEKNREFGAQGRRAVCWPGTEPEVPPSNTTIGVVATDAALTKAQARKIAQMAHDGLARAIRPAHTMFDGDTIFCFSTGRKPLPETPGFFAAPQTQSLNDLGRAAVDFLTRAIIRAALKAGAWGL